MATLAFVVGMPSPAHLDTLLANCLVPIVFAVVSVAFVGHFRDLGAREPLVAQRPVTDLVILDLRLTGAGATGVRQGPVAVRAVAELGYRICLNADERRKLVLAQCLRAGAHGVVHKSDPVETASAAFLAVAGGQTVVTQSLVGVAEVLERRVRCPTSRPGNGRCSPAGPGGERWSGIARRIHITEGWRGSTCSPSMPSSRHTCSTAPPATSRRCSGSAPVTCSTRARPAERGGGPRAIGGGVATGRSPGTGRPAGKPLRSGRRARWTRRACPRAAVTAGIAVGRPCSDRRHELAVSGCAPGRGAAHRLGRAYRAATSRVR